MRHQVLTGQTRTARRPHERENGRRCALRLTPTTQAGYLRQEVFGDGSPKSMVD
jgi:hypothetical protein